MRKYCPKCGLGPSKLLTENIFRDRYYECSNIVCEHLFKIEGPSPKITGDDLISPEEIKMKARGRSVAKEERPDRPFGR